MNAKLAFMPHKPSLSMTDFANGVSFAFTKAGGLLVNLLGWFGSASLNLLAIDLSAWLTALPAFLSTVAAVVVGTYFSYRKKKDDADRRRETDAIDTMDRLLENGTIPQSASTEERMRITKEFMDSF